MGGETEALNYIQTDGSGYVKMIDIDPSNAYTIEGSFYISTHDLSHDSVLWFCTLTQCFYSPTYRSGSMVVNNHYGGGSALRRYYSSYTPRTEGRYWAIKQTISDSACGAGSTSVIAMSPEPSWSSAWSFANDTNTEEYVFSILGREGVDRGLPDGSRFYWMIIYKTTSGSRDNPSHLFLPAKSGNTVGVYDSVTGTFYAGSGGLTIG